MKEIIFWFSNHKIRKYWLDYSIGYCKRVFSFQDYFNRLESWIKIADLKISFKVNDRGDIDLAGYWDKNQYWVEDLFDNNFEEFFKELVKENI